MILGFLGKGGSGKSSVSTQMTLALHAEGRNVLAIDADHNMDLSFNLLGGALPIDMPYLGEALDELYESIGLTSEDTYDEAFIRDNNVRFSFTQNAVDSFTTGNTHIVRDGLRLMSAGPQTDVVLYGKTCGHILSTPLKIYLPFLKLDKNDEVILDEKAGADGVTTGIVTGIDVAVIVCEPALHSIKTAEQLVNLLAWYDTPYLIVGNKIASLEDKEFIESHLTQKPVVYFMQNNDVRRAPGEIAVAWQKDLRTLYNESKKLNRNDRLSRTKMKVARNAQFAEIR